ncbi:hypothetical protein HYS72_00305 [Candidatus Pacearchaeota archaeon]|nr:hypothetical protein [Candidatus Pacearchaeota archaeon]
MTLESAILNQAVLNHAVHGLNLLEGGTKSVEMTIINESDAYRLKGNLTNYNVEINRSFVTGFYTLKVSKKEKK